VNGNSRAILVTGAAGFAGSHVLDMLVRGASDGAAPEAGSVVGWHRPRHAPARPRETVLWDAIDLLDRSAVAAAIARLRPSIVYHCAGAAHVGRAWEQTERTLATNVRGTHYLLDALRRADVESRVLIPSSAMVYEPAGEPLAEGHPLVPAGPYGFSKLAQELLGGHDGSDSGVEVTIARAFNHFGPRQDPAFSTAGFARQIAAIEARRQPAEIAVGNLDARRDLTDVRDVVRAYRLIVERAPAGRPFNVCSGRALAIREVLERLVARARVPIRLRVDPARLRPSDVPVLLGDPGRIRDELGWAPEIPLEQTLDEVLDYWRGEVA
jgi:GDP-4-dehydro-6-deoxy-D-mannose reductase